MKEDKKICYPYAYSRLDASLDYLASNLEMDCILAEINVDLKVIDLLKENINRIQKLAVEESLEHNV